MNVLDENIVESQRQLLRRWRIHVRQIGHEMGRAGMQDEEIIALLHRTGRVTFLTRDLRFYEAKNRTRDYCIVCLAVGQYEVAVFVRKVLRHSALNTQAKRMGKIIRVTHTGIRYWLAAPPRPRAPRHDADLPEPLARGCDQRVPAQVVRLRVERSASIPLIPTRRPIAVRRHGKPKV